MFNTKIVYINHYLCYSSKSYLLNSVSQVTGIISAIPRKKDLSTPNSIYLYIYIYIYI